jgi:dUTP pyrophosphatase
MIKFEKVQRFANVDLPLPTRATSNSAGYDFVVAEDIVIPPYDFIKTKIQDALFEKDRPKDYYAFINPLTLDEMASVTKDLGTKVTLVSTGMKCHLEPGQYLELSVRSSTPLKHWLIMANGVGIVDADYYNSSANEGEIFFQIINLAPFAIQLKRGDRIGQGIIKNYLTIDDDSAEGTREGGFGSTGT